ncbi:hypothetical protein C8R44DRAFT_889848 [Mycena epipterygia]|nr:hypothetical protein C8R44DRAFT_889848 [Mycena epipterygia]
MISSQKRSMPPIADPSLPYISLQNSQNIHSKYGEPPAYISLEMTIQSMENGEVGPRKHTTSPKSSASLQSPSSPKSQSPMPALDEGVVLYETSLLRRDAVGLQRMGVANPEMLDAAVLRGIQPRAPQRQPLNPARQRLLGILSPGALPQQSPPSSVRDDSQRPHSQRPHKLKHATAATDSTASSTEVPHTSTKRHSQFSQLFPEGMCAPGQAPLLSMADMIYQSVLKDQMAKNVGDVTQPRWARATIRRAPTRSEQAREAPETGGCPVSFGDESIVESVAPTCPRARTTYTSAEDTLRGLRIQSPIDCRPSMEVHGLRLPHPVNARHRKHTKPSDACVAEMEERERGILEEIMNRQYVRRRESD